MSLNARFIERIREKKDERGLTMQDIADFCAWNKAKLVKKFGGETEVSLDEAEQLCFAVGLTLTEAVRDRGLEFCAEMTPTELRRLERFRSLPKRTTDAVDHILEIQSDGLEKRGATPKRPIFGKARAK